MIEMMHKLLVTSVLVFLPMSTQMAADLCVVGLYLMILLLLNPYKSTGDDRIHLLVQTELIILSTMGWELYTDANKLSAALDLILSI